MLYHGDGSILETAYEKHAAHIIALGKADALEEEFRDNHDWGVQGEENIDPTEYDDYDPIADDPEAYMDYDDHDPSDNELYHYGQW